MEEALLALLQSSAAVTAIVGGRINWGAHPQGAPLPGIVLTVIDDAEGHIYQGPDGLSQGRVQVDCWALTYDEAKACGRAVRAALDGHFGGMFLGMFLADQRDGREGGTNEADRPFRSSLDFLTHWRG